MKKNNDYENDILNAYEKGELVSTNPTRQEKEKYKDAAQSSFLKDRRVNIRLSSPDLIDIQARALEDGVPYQTLIASVLHKYVTGRLSEKPSRLTNRSTRRAKEQQAA
ncbi:MAG: hypothetical protein PHN84_13615 [Desulfuromonadaceae bacterium]|nr:hypothetical protein [Desulfuromonadaceae bacterium]MDD2855744.1 hypothetical protein [Desulfuromonadaceae bacterium]